MTSLITQIKPAKTRRFQAPGSASSLGFFLSLILFFFSLSAPSEEKKSKNSEGEIIYNAFEKKASHFVDQSPYIPNKRDYSLELGTLWEEQTFAWIGGYVGFHLGRCFLISEEHCQIYLDAMGGIGLHSDDSASWAMAGWRWQFIDYPSPWSYSVRFMLGLAHSNIQSVIRNEPMYGVGFGLTRYLHKRLDLRAEFRVGYTHQVFTQFNLGFQVKVDEWVGYFADKVKNIGKGTLNATGRLLKATGKAVTSPFTSGDKKVEEPKKKP